MSEFSQNINLNNERRIAPRYKINLGASVLITAISTSVAGEETYLVFQAELRDVSITGLALVVSFDEVRELKMLGDDLVIHLLLPLPTQAVELEAIPARYQVLDESKNGKVLIGAHISNMNGRNRVVFMDFIRENEIAQNLDTSAVAG